eukprot:7304813-Alexandrium_andersonii.AAC.1
MVRAACGAPPPPRTSGCPRFRPPAPAAGLSSGPRATTIATGARGDLALRWPCKCGGAGGGIGFWPAEASPRPVGGCPVLLLGVPCGVGPPGLVVP